MQEKDSYSHQKAKIYLIIDKIYLKEPNGAQKPKYIWSLQKNPKEKIKKPRFKMHAINPNSFLL